MSAFFAGAETTTRFAPPSMCRAALNNGKYTGALHVLILYEELFGIRSEVNFIGPKPISKHLLVRKFHREIARDCYPFEKMRVCSNGA